MELRHFASTLLRNWGVIVAAVLIGILASSIHALMGSPQYQSSTRAYVSVQSAASIADLSQANTFAQQAVGSYVELATTPYVLQRAVKDDDLPVSADQLAGAVSASASGDSAVLNVTATADTPVLATRIASAVTDSLIASVKDLSPSTSSVNASLKITEVQPASSAVRLGTSVASELLVGALLGLLLGVALAVVRDRSSVRVGSVSAISALTDAPVLARVPHDPTARTRRLTADYDASPERTEAYRSLRAALQTLDRQRSLRTIVVTSSVAGEGKTATVANLAIALALSGESVVVVDADLRQPGLAQQFGMMPGPGLVEVLAGETAVEAAVQTWSEAPVSVLGAGRPTSHSSELVQSREMQDLITRLAAAFSVVLIDTPPLLPVSDGAILAARCSGVIMIVALERVRSMEVERGLGMLHQFGANPFGVVATMVPRGGADGVYKTYGSYTSSAD